MRHPQKWDSRRGSNYIEGLLYAALLGSANDAAVALAEAVSGSEQEFVSLMNQKALLIGAENTKFVNATGLPGGGQHTTVLDLSKILNYALRIPKLREIIGTTEAKITTEKGKVFNLRSTDRLLWSDEKIIGGKTGYTRKAGHCFVVAAQMTQERFLWLFLGAPAENTYGGIRKNSFRRIFMTPPIKRSFHRGRLQILVLTLTQEIASGKFPLSFLFS